MPSKLISVSHNAHLLEVRNFWNQVIDQDSVLIDATCGNGFDLQAWVISYSFKSAYAIDIQEQAIVETKKKIEDSRVSFILGSHEHFPIEKPIVSLINYNLGYLPKSNKKVKTLPHTTLNSVKKGLTLLKKGGGIVIVCYSGHLEGAKEKEALLNWLPQIDASDFLVAHKQWLNRPNHPSVITILRVSEPEVFER